MLPFYKYRIPDRLLVEYLFGNNKGVPSTLKARELVGIWARINVELGPTASHVHVSDTSKKENKFGSNQLTKRYCYQLSSISHLQLDGLKT